MNPSLENIRLGPRKEEEKYEAKCRIEVAVNGHGIGFVFFILFYAEL